MHFKTLIACIFVTLSTAQRNATNTTCGATRCPSGRFCTSATLTSPSTITSTCVPTPTCLTVSSDCSSGGSSACCSGNCTASRCRVTDPNWPCSEDGGVCRTDDDCCYGNGCSRGLCLST
ncbi:hypothetical protein BO70DRAFT_400478 [Aspergillus heteromorphus CBS 117.55]|uniref:Uncharacterized protein n=1 Tax=Aspergillus heteromorphus CBS 117.55 TaxID=1448321 RepID=A0A317V0V6_9EURO|nr:uncharacterized protein BO70DRAFT_400478 [Aspergillus heteromorphus CBS 117.55]PWY67903.1 hypothetical protein BO70DRAFT_400478 [Aspergillus heteromorphus CBS 117.55]